MPKQATIASKKIVKVDPVEVAVNEMINNNNHILIDESNVLKQQILEFNQSILNIHEKLITIHDYISLFGKQVFPNVDLKHMTYFLQLYQNPSFINADDLGPQRFGIISIRSNKKSLESRDIKTLLDQYDFVENKDYFKSGDVPALYSKKPRAVYVISPLVLKTCLTGAKTLGRTYRNYYFFLETSIHAYNDYQSTYALEDRKDTIRRIEENTEEIKKSNARLEADNKVLKKSNARLEVSSKHISSKLDIALDNLDVLKEMHSETNIEENIVTPPSDVELHTQFAVFKTNAPTSVVYDRKFHYHHLYTSYRTQKTRLDKIEKELCVTKSTHKCILKIDVHSSMYVWTNIRKDTKIATLIRVMKYNDFVLRDNTNESDLIIEFINIAKENNLNVINTLSDIPDVPRIASESINDSNDDDASENGDDAIDESSSSASNV